MQSFNASNRLSSRVLAAMLMLAMPTWAIAANATPQNLEADTPQVQTSIEEWHWRDMAF